MKTVKVSEATPIQLDWLVAKCLGITVIRSGAGPSQKLAYMPMGKRSYYTFAPTTKWKQGGPLIEARHISTVFREATNHWMAMSYKLGLTDSTAGPTPLIAGFRCLVTSEMGETVEIPKELT